MSNLNRVPEGSPEGGQFARGGARPELSGAGLSDPPAFDGSTPAGMVPVDSEYEADISAHVPEGFDSATLTYSDDTDATSITTTVSVNLEDTLSPEVRETHSEFVTSYIAGRFGGYVSNDDDMVPQIEHTTTVDHRDTVDEAVEAHLSQGAGRLQSALDAHGPASFDSQLRSRMEAFAINPDGSGDEDVLVPNWRSPHLSEHVDQTSKRATRETPTGAWLPDEPRPAPSIAINPASVSGGNAERLTQPVIFANQRVATEAMGLSNRQKFGSVELHMTPERDFVAIEWPDANTQPGMSLDDRARAEHVRVTNALTRAYETRQRIPEHALSDAMRASVAIREHGYSPNPTGKPLEGPDGTSYPADCVIVQAANPDGSSSYVPRTRGEVEQVFTRRADW